MTQEQLSLIVALVLIVACVIGLMIFLAQRKTKRLKARFGGEYARVVQESGSRRKGEARLVAREKRRDAITIVPLALADRDHYRASWSVLQAEFVEDPKYAVTQADHLLAQVMSKRGYPMGEFEQRSADLSVDHPLVVQNYRAAHDIAVRHSLGQASTEDLRQAMLFYRTLFSELIGEADPLLGGPGVTPARAA